MTFTNFLKGKAEEPTGVNQAAPTLWFKQGAIVSRTNCTR